MNFGALSGIAAKGAKIVSYIRPNFIQVGRYLVMSDIGEGIVKNNSTAMSITIPVHVLLAMPIGCAVTCANLGGTTANLTIARMSGVALYLGGTNADIVLTPGSSVTIWKLADNIWQA